MTTTWSPLFRWGVKVGLCLPRRIAATPDARRPRTWSVASTTYHSDFRSAVLAVHVFCLLTSSSVNHFHQCQPPGGSCPRRPAAVPRVEDRPHPFRGPFVPPHLGERARDAARQASAEPLRGPLHLPNPPMPREP